MYIQNRRDGSKISLRVHLVPASKTQLIAGLD